jgi:hypothetical protein
MIASNNNGVQEAVVDMMRYRAMVYRHQDTLLQLVGPESNEWKDADMVRQNVSSLIQGLEDLEAHTMMGRDEVEARYEAGKLIYQAW